MITSKKRFSIILSVFFLTPVGAFLTSYLFVVRGSPGSEFLDRLGAVGALLSTVSWCIHMLVTSTYLLPIHAVVPQYFEHSKLVGLVPYPEAFIIGTAFYVLVACAFVAICGWCGSRRSRVPADRSRS
jgi:hypothetical protein